MRIVEYERIRTVLGWGVDERPALLHRKGVVSEGPTPIDFRSRGNGYHRRHMGVEWACRAGPHWATSCSEARP